MKNKPMMKTRVKLAVNNPIWDLILRAALTKGLDKELTTDERLTVLEVGCGRGGTTELLLKWLPNAFVTAVDVDDEQIRLAERHVKNKRVEFMVEHAAEMSFEDGMFDLVTQFNTLHHIPAWRKAIAETSRVLKPGGQFSLVGPTAKSFSYTMFRKFVAPKSLFFVNEVIEEAAKHGLTLKRNLGSPLYMKLIFRRINRLPQKRIVAI